MDMPNTASLLGILALAGLLPLQACATTYSAEPIEAWVVDAETNQPIEGVVVTANWELESGTVGGNVAFGQIMVMETVTDKAGRFCFPAWGPKSTPFHVPVPLLESSPHLVNHDPYIVLFKSSYKWTGLANKFAGDYNRGELRRSDWNGKTVKMEKFRGELKEYSRHLDLLRGRLHFVEEECNWKLTPTMVLALDEQKKVFRTRGISSNLYSVDGLELMSDQQRRSCGSAREFFKGVRQ